MRKLMMGGLVAALIAVVPLAALAEREKCTDPGCENFQADVSPGHRHRNRCTDTGCVNFQAFVSPDHQHRYK